MRHVHQLADPTKARVYPPKLQELVEATKRFKDSQRATPGIEEELPEPDVPVAVTPIADTIAEGDVTEVEHLGPFAEDIDGEPIDTEYDLFGTPPQCCGGEPGSSIIDTDSESECEFIGMVCRCPACLAPGKILPGRAFARTAESGGDSQATLKLGGGGSSSDEARNAPYDDPVKGAQKAPKAQKKPAGNEPVGTVQKKPAAAKKAAAKTPAKARATASAKAPGCTRATTFLRQHRANSLRPPRQPSPPEASEPAPKKAHTSGAPGGTCGPPSGPPGGPPNVPDGTEGTDDLDAPLRFPMNVERRHPQTNRVGEAYLRQAPGDTKRYSMCVSISRATKELTHPNIVFRSLVSCVKSCFLEMKNKPKSIPFRSCSITLC